MNWISGTVHRFIWGESTFYYLFLLNNNMLVLFKWLVFDYMLCLFFMVLYPTKTFLKECFFIFTYSPNGTIIKII